VLKVTSISRSFGDKEVLSDVSFSLKPASINGLIGPSGGGKSILFKIIANTCRADRGWVTFPQGATHRDVGLMFQEGALFDSLSVYDNIAFPLVVRCPPQAYLEIYVRRSAIKSVIS
jgi:phospholipid/cholesterol/gamma-HCH transport system ATP-binding protein